MVVDDQDRRSHHSRYSQPDGPVTSVLARVCPSVPDPGSPPANERRELGDADEIAEGLSGVAGEGGVAPGTRCCRARQAKQRSHLAEMVAGAERGEQELSVGCLADDIDLAGADD